MRIERPVGTLLLLWPTLAALIVAADGLPQLVVLVVFALGTLVMRSAGCVINDIADRHVDGFVERTKNRPLPSGDMSVTAAWALFAGLVTVAFALVLALDWYTQRLAAAGLLVAIVYPFMKRWTYLPQLVLGAAFSWGILLAFGEVQGQLPPEAWLMFLASLVWIVAYDTLYAMVDREDDIEVGVKSTAILFGTADRLIVGLLQILTITIFVLLGRQLDYGVPYFVSLAVCAGLFVHQQRLIKNRERDACFAAFANNVWVGFALFVGVSADIAIGNLLTSQ